jgi:acyl carrier protein
MIGLDGRHGRREVDVEQSEFIGLVEEILEAEPGSVHLEDSLDELGWDSLSNIGFIAEVDDRLNRSIEAEQLTAATTVADLLAIVDASR